MERYSVNSIRESTTTTTYKVAPNVALEGTVELPAFTWDKFVLLNVEVQRLSALCNSLVTENESLKARTGDTTLLVVENERLRTEVKNLKLRASEAELLAYRVRDLGSEKERITEVMIEKSRENDGLRMKASAVHVLEGKVEHAEHDKRALLSHIQEQELVIRDLKAQVIEYEQDLAVLRSVNDRVSLLAVENERLRTIIVEKAREIESYQVRAAKHSTVETEYKAVAEERKGLQSLLIDRAQVVDDLRAQIAEIELDTVAITEIKQRFALVEAENEKLTTLLATTIKENEEYKRKLVALGEVEIKLKLAIQEKEKVTSLLTEKYSETQELRTKAGELNKVEQRVTLLLTEKERLTQERERLSIVIGEKLAEIESLKVKAAEAEVLAHRVKNLGTERERLTEVIVEKARENEGLRAKASAVPNLEERVEVVTRDRETLERVLLERETVISELRHRIAEVEHEFVVLDELKAKITLIATENERLRSALEETSKQRDSYILKTSDHNEVKTKLQSTIEERDRLTLIITDRLREVESLRMRLIEAERNGALVAELQGKLAMLATENDRLGQILIEKIEIIEEWQNKYAVLENLYLSVRETTEQLDFIKKKYENIVETSERADQKLRLSVDAKVLRKSVVKYGDMSHNRTPSSGGKTADSLYASPQSSRVTETVVRSYIH